MLFVYLKESGAIPESTRGLFSFIFSHYFRFCYRVLFYFPEEFFLVIEVYSFSVKRIYSEEIPVLSARGAGPHITSFSNAVRNFFCTSRKRASSPNPGNISRNIIDKPVLEYSHWRVHIPH